MNEIETVARVEPTLFEALIIMMRAMVDDTPCYEAWQQANAYLGERGQTPMPWCGSEIDSVKEMKHQRESE